uniref:Hematopoietic death receptor n=1 Tax=Oryzias sinensis TaxID=183150 RepID=A0A8C7X4K1_9TELE
MEVCRFMVSVGCLAFLVTLTAANLPPGLRVRRRRHFGSCGEQEYPNGNICCLNCKAGTFVKSPCTTAGQRGTCEECDYGTFTEHDNHLQKCVDCAKCGPDQEVAEQCTNTQNTKCRCKAGRFCNPEEACEVCRKCLTCKRDEEVVRNCTFTSNTVCKKIPLKPGSSLDAVFFVLCVIPAILFLVAGGIFLKYKKKCGCRGSSEASPAVAKSEENCRGSSAALILISVSRFSQRSKEKHSLLVEPALQYLGEKC